MNKGRSLEDAFTVRQSPENLNKIGILEIRFNILEAIASYEYFEMVKDQRANTKITTLRALGKQLAWSLVGEMGRSKKLDFSKVLNDLGMGNKAQVLDTIKELLLYLDSLKLTRIDTSPQTGGIAEIQNKADGY